MEYIGVIESGSSNELIIHLIRYNLRWSFRRRELLEMFPKSLIATALDIDPTVKELSLGHPDVTPLSISILYIIAEKNGYFKPYANKLKINDTEMYRASRYLMIPELGVFCSDKIWTLLEKYDYNNRMFQDKERKQYNLRTGYDKLTDTEYLAQEYDNLTYQFAEFRNYLWSLVPPSESTRHSDDHLLLRILFECNIDFFKEIIIKRKVNINTTNHPYLDWQIAKAWPIWKDVIFYPLLYGEKSGSVFLLYTCQMPDDELLSWLVKNTDIADEKGETLDYLAKKDQFKAVYHLLTHIKYSSEQLRHSVGPMLRNGSELTDDMNRVMEFYEKAIS